MLKIIDNYRDLPIGMYQEICAIDRRQDLDDLSKQVLTISLLTYTLEEEILDLPISEYRALAAKATFLEQEYTGKILTAKSYQIGHLTLIPIQDYRKITTAQYIDFQTFAKDPDQNVVEILSTMLIPKGKKYNQGYDIVEVQDAIRDHLSVADALSLLAFFFVRYHRLIVDSLTSCKRAAKRIPDPEKRIQILKRIKEQEEILLRIGDGSRL